MPPNSNSSNQVHDSQSASLEPDIDHPATQTQPDIDEENNDVDGSTMQAQSGVDEQNAEPVSAESPPSVPAVQRSAFAEVPAPSYFYQNAREREEDRAQWYMHVSRRYNRMLRNSILVGGASLILGIGAMAFVITRPSMPSRSTWIISICVVIALIVLYCLQNALRSRKWLETNRPVLDQINQMRGWPSPHDKRTDSQRKADSLRERHTPDDARTNNQLLIDRYHQLTTQQAATSYRNSQIAMAAGLALLIAGAVITMRATSGSAQLVVGALTGLGAALSTYLGATFIRTYERALLQMNYYFGQPLVTSYILEAERLSGKLSKAKRDDALSDIIAETLLGASNASHALSPDPQDQAAKRASNRARTRAAEKETKVAEKDAKTADNQ